MLFMKVVTYTINRNVDDIFNNNNKSFIFFLYYISLKTDESTYEFEHL